MSRVLIFTIIVFQIVLIAVKTKKGYGPGEQDWGYVDVRVGAHMFYWLYYTTATTNYTDRPLAIWLQGGPGASSTGIGNFKELGPLDIYGNYRNFTWVTDMNVLFIDNPVGSGFSYVDGDQYYPTNNTQIAWDLVSLMKGFYKNYPEFEKVPLHIFTQSYGGKMAPEFALELYYAIQRGELKSNLKSVALGNPWTSPIDSMLAYAPLLLYTGVVDNNGYDKIMAAVNETAELVAAEKWIQAIRHYWNYTMNVILRESKGVDVYNIEKPTRANTNQRMGIRNPELMIRTLVGFGIDEDYDAILSALMLGPVSKKLSIPSNVKWGSLNGSIGLKLEGDLMKPALHIVEELLEKTDLQVAVNSGQLDLICASAGTVNWINKMKWSYKNEYDAAPRSAINVNNILEGYEKSAGKFTMFWIKRSGHSVPADNSKGMGHVLRKLTKYG